jgi:glucose/arabinose dehydrogenase
MRWRLVFACLLAAAAVAGCGKDSPPASPPASGSAETVTGRERIGWIQSSASAGDANVLQFAAYVDGSRRVLEGVTCAAESGDTLQCSAPLPSLSAGRHTLEMATFVPGENGFVESPRSAPLELTVASVVAQSAGSATAASGSTFRASDGLELRAELLAADLANPVDVAIDANGRAFVAERRGTLRVIGPGAATDDGSRVESLFGSRDRDSRALAIALAPDFDSSHLVYALGVQPAANGSRVFVTRLRELHGTLGEAAVVVSRDIAAVDPHGVLRFGPDGAMYVAAGDVNGGGGEILRFLADGRIPPDNPSAAPLYSRLDLAPAGLAWEAADGALWTLETSAAVDRLAVRRRSSDRAAVGLAASARIDSAGAADLPRGTRASGLTIVNAAASSLDGDVIVASMGLADLLRFGRASGGTSTAPARLLQGRFGAIGGVTAALAGDIYFFTANNDTWGAGQDVLVRLRAAQ